MWRRLPTYVRNEFWLTLAAVAGFCVFYILSENAHGWAGLGYALYAMGVAALWIAVSAIYMIWIIIRERGGSTARPAMGVLAVVLVLAAAFIAWLES